MEKPLMPTYKRLPIAFVRGAGPWLWDEGGTRYLDALAGIAVCGLGHAHPAVARALCEQASQLVHTSNLYRVPVQTELAARLTDVAAMDNVFFCNSGAEANEACLKLARLYGHRRGIATPQVAVMDGAFHGRTLATLSATANPAIQQGFEPLVSGFVRVPFNDPQALAETISRTPDLVAVLVEPIQGEGGVRLPAPGYLREVRHLCDEAELLLMLDEVQTGMCRTGRWFAHQHDDIRPDLMSLAKALGNGVPIGACLARGVAAELMEPGKHGSTFGGNPLACRAALAVIETLENEGLAGRAATLGQRLVHGFEKSLHGLAGVRACRGLGLMIGIELEQPAAGLVEQALAEGVLINVTAGNVVRLLPPLVISDAEAEEIVQCVSRALRTHLGAKS
jgi:acetylornithine/N-succinyldiaminopimelate aminotransferase